MRQQRFFIMEVAPDPWGDYGHILTHGMSMHSERTTAGMLQLERCGPYIPPISLPGLQDIVVTNDFRHKLQESRLKGFDFQAVAKLRIVRNDWHDGSRKSDEPPEYPDEGEPENYILELPHDEDLAKKMGELWEIVPQQGCHTTRQRRIVASRKEIALVLDGWQGQDVFRADGVLYNYVTERARDWFMQHVSSLLTFEEAVTT